MLTDIRCRNAKPQDKAYKLADSGGLYLYVTPTGFKSWRLKFRVDGTEKRLTFGGYPEVSLTEARERRDQARKQLRDGLDPAIEKKKRLAERSTRSDNSYRAAFERWHEAQEPHWSPRYAKQVKARFENDVLQALGALPVHEITVPLVLDTMRKVEKRGSVEIAHRLRQHMSDVFAAEIAAGATSANPAAGIAKAMKRYSWKRRPAADTIELARQYLAKIEQSDARSVSKLASRLTALTAARPGVVRLAEPGEFEDLHGEAPLWRIPAAKMKLTVERKNDIAFEFVIPLSPAAVDVVTTALNAFPGKRVFGAVRNRSKPISDSTLSKLYREVGLQGRHVPHGWRSSFSTMMNEIAALENRVGDREVIDLMLAHLPSDVESTYNRYAYLPRRRELAEEWAALLMKDARPASSLL